MDDEGVPRRRGRPRGGTPDGKSRIRKAAITEFGAHGYDGATVRGIADRAGVDPALIHHHFGSKADLFADVVGAPAQPGRLLAAALEGDVHGAGERIARAAFTPWESPSFRSRGVAVMRAAVGSKRMSKLAASYFSREMVTQIEGVLAPDPQASRRAGLVVSQVLGVFLTRHVLEFGAARDIPLDQLVTAVGATLQRYLTGPLDSADEAPRA
ncbi:TetR family transcriptional regulator [Microbacterium koreense]|uniref:TetR family transcriptional regulator n=1 Tax=Microbacterium koreense TaxID=323761 RepID=A0ABW2ZRS5_9MICO